MDTKLILKDGQQWTDLTAQEQNEILIELSLKKKTSDKVTYHRLKNTSKSKKIILQYANELSDLYKERTKLRKVLSEQGLTVSDINDLLHKESNQNYFIEKISETENIIKIKSEQVNKLQCIDPDVIQKTIS